MLGGALGAAASRWTVCCVFKLSDDGPVQKQAPNRVLVLEWDGVHCCKAATQIKQGRESRSDTWQPRPLASSTGDATAPLCTPAEGAWRSQQLVCTAQHGAGSRLFTGRGTRVLGTLRVMPSFRLATAATLVLLGYHSGDQSFRLQLRSQQRVQPMSAKDAKPPSYSSNHRHV